MVALQIRVECTNSLTTNKRAALQGRRCTKELRKKVQARQQRREAHPERRTKQEGTEQQRQVQALREDNKRTFTEVAEEPKLDKTANRQGAQGEPEDNRSDKGHGKEPELSPEDTQNHI